MPIAQVQRQPFSNGFASANSYNLTVTSTAAGNCLLVAAQIGSGASGLAVSDNKANSYTQVYSDGSFGLWRCLSAVGGVTTLTISDGGAGPFTYGVMFTEWSGVTGFDASSGTGTGTAGATFSSGSVNAASTAELAYAFAWYADGTSTMSGPVNGSFTSPGATLTWGAGNGSARDGWWIGASGTGILATWGVGNTGSTYKTVIALFTSPLAPNAPTLASPGSGASLDVTAGVTFQSTYNSNDSANENAYALRQKASGAGSYNYWTGTAWQSTIIWPTVSVAPAGTTSVGPISTGLSNGNVYNWSMASQEAIGSLQGPFASDFAFTAQAAPVLVVNGPNGTVTTTNQPTVAWTTTPAPGAFQTAYRVVIEHGAYGSVPGSGTQDWDSGTKTSANQQETVGTGGTPNGAALANGTTYRAFVQVTETGAVTSSWRFVTFTVSLDLPQTPTIAAVVGTDPSTGCPRIALTVQGRDNALTATQASFEDGTTTGWAAGTSTAIANTTAQADDGTHSMSLTRQSTTGAASATTPTGASGVPVTASQPWQALANFRTAVTGRTCTVQVFWYKASGAASSVRASDTSAGVTDTTSGWTQAALAVTSPSDAAFAALVVSVAGAVANEVHYVDNIDLGPGSSAVWTRGGLAGSTTVAILRSDGLYVRLASIATPTPIPTPSQTVTVYDYEAVPGVAYTYTAVVSAVIGGSTISSATSTATGSVTVALATYGWWWLDPTNPSTAIAAQPIQWQPAQVEQSSAHTVLQQVTANIVAAAMMNPGFAGQIEVFDNTTYANFVALITSQTTLFISSPWGSADSGYFRVGPTPDGMSSGMGLKVKAAQLLPSAGTAGHRTVDVSAVPQPRPTV